MEVDYGFYVDSYGGTELTEAAWKRLSGKAVQRLSHFTFDRIPEDWEKMPWLNQAKCAVCEMAEFFFIQEKSSGKTSENTDVMPCHTNLIRNQMGNYMRLPILIWEIPA